MSGDKLRSPHVSWVFAQLVTFPIFGRGATAFEPLAGGPLSRLAATAPPRGEPSLASPFGGRWCPVGTVQRLTEPAGESAPAGGGEGSVRPPSWCAAVREKRFAVSLAFSHALRAYKGRVVGLWSHLPVRSAQGVCHRQTAPYNPQLLKKLAKLLRSLRSAPH